MERRNELLSILYLVKSNSIEEEELNLKRLFEFIEININNQIKELERNRFILEEDLKTLNFIKKELEEK